MREIRQVQLKLRPTKAQERTMDRWLWHLTGVWNWALMVLEREPGLSAFDIKARLTGHSDRMGISSRALNGVAQTAHEAWRRHLAGLVRRPRRKGRRNKLSSIAFTHWKNLPRNGRICVPLLGSVRFHRQDILAGHIGQARIVRRASGWYLCLFIQASPEAIPVVASGDVGIDPGFSSLVTLSTGEKIEHPHEWRQTQKRLGQAQRGSRQKLAARLHERVRNQRKDRNHKLSHRIVAENRTIVFSADRHAAIARAFGRSVESAGHFRLRQMLSYKSRAGGRRYIEVASRNSTRTCSACGALSGPTGWRGLSVRFWDCGACGAHHDRDVNAAMNTLRIGLGTSLKVRREAVSGIAPSATLRGSNDRTRSASHE